MLLLGYALCMWHPPLPRSLRQPAQRADLCYSQVASALMARHIGGAVNYVGVAETLSITPSAQAAGLAADSLICAFYFAGLFKLASGIGADAEPTAHTTAAADSKPVSQSQEVTGGIQVTSLQHTASCNHGLHAIIADTVNYPVMFTAMTTEVNN